MTRPRPTGGRPWSGWSSADRAPTAPLDGTNEDRLHVSEERVHFVGVEFGFSAAAKFDGGVDDRRIGPAAPRPRCPLELGAHDVVHREPPRPTGVQNRVQRGLLMPPMP